jgi:ketosteroid isomerase-like protein
VSLRRNGYAAVFLLLVCGPVAACGDTTGAQPPPNHPEPATQAGAPATAISAADASAPPPAAAAPLSMFDMQLKALRDYVSAFNRHDAAAIGALYDQDAVFMERGEFTSIGESITANYQRYFDAFPDCSTAITRSWHKEDLAIFEYAEGGTNTGPYRSQKPTGKKVGYSGASVLRFSAKGLVKQDSTYYDQLTMDVQVGWARGPVAKLEVRPVTAVPPATGTWEAHPLTSADVGQAKVSAVRKSLHSSLQTRAEQDYLAALSDDVVLAPYDDPKDAAGKPEAARLFEGWLKVFSPGAVDDDDGWSVDGYVVILGTFGGTHVGSWGPLKATNKTFKSHFLDVVRMNQSDKIDRVWTYANNYEILRDLGYEQ